MTGSPTKFTKTAQRSWKPSRRVSSITCNLLWRVNGRVPTPAVHLSVANWSRPSCPMAMRGIFRAFCSTCAVTNSRTSGSAKPSHWRWILNGLTASCSTTRTAGCAATLWPVTLKPRGALAPKSWFCWRPHGESCRLPCSIKRCLSRLKPSSPPIRATPCATICAKPETCSKTPVGLTAMALCAMPKACP